MKTFFKELRFALYATKKNIQGSAELRTSFLANVAGMAINNIAFIIMWVFFVRSVGVIGGWTAADIVAMQGFVALSFGIVFSVGVGIRKLPEYVASGGFDRFMLSPKNLLVRIATSSFNASGIGDMIFGIVCLVIYAFLIHITFHQVLVLLAMVIVTTLLFLAVVTAIYATSFYFVDANAVTTSLFEFFVTPSFFDGGAFQGVVRFIFTFFIPSLLIGALPVEAVRDFSLWKLALVFVLTIAWFALAMKIFQKAVRKYESSTFFTFGN